MITMNALLALEENDGLTLKNGEAITYKSGWQVATEGVEYSPVAYRTYLHGPGDTL